MYSSSQPQRFMDYSLLEANISGDQTESSLELKEFHVSHYYPDPYTHHPYHELRPDSSSYSLEEEMEEVEEEEEKELEQPEAATAVSATVLPSSSSAASSTYIIRMPPSSSCSSSLPDNKFTRKRERVVQHSHSNQTLFKFTK